MIRYLIIIIIIILLYPLLRIFIFVTHLRGLFNRINELKLKTNGKEFIGMETYNNDSSDKYQLFRVV